MTTTKAAATPLMRQYGAIKRRYQDAILFFRMGDFYEMFYEDATLAAPLLGLTLTSRNNGKAAQVPLAGVPIKAADGYIRKLVQLGFKVAICEQLEDASQASGIVKRDVVEVVTPGTVLDEAILDRTRNTYLVALAARGDQIGLAFVDCSTGELGVSEPESEVLSAELKRIAPAELLVPIEWRGPHSGPPVGVVADLLAAPPALNPIKEGQPELPVSLREGWKFDPTEATAEICQRFDVSGLDGFGCAEMSVAIGAAGAIVSYLNEVQPGALAILRPPRPHFSRDFMTIDETTLINLELLEPLRDGGRAATLLGTMDHTKTAMGARRLRAWIARPLTSRETIEARHTAVGALVEDAVARGALADSLKSVQDLERLAGRTASGRANPRDLVALADTLRAAPEVQRVAAALAVGRWGDLEPDLSGHPDVIAAIDEAIVDDPPVALGDGDAIRDGYDDQLDGLRVGCREGREWIAKLQQEERERTGIKSLKVGFNKVFGYYLEVTKTNLAAVPEHYIRKQTISTGERYITPELKEVESQILGAEEKIAARESELFARLRSDISKQAAELQTTADALSEADVLVSLADVAARNDFCRPQMTDEPGISIRAGRHPVVEKWLEGETFVPNDAELDAESTQIIILTGPNMAGKSTYLRQIGLIAALAQMGSWIPAESARLGVVDRLFTRVGASDNLARGQSTFLVEMIETANIMHNATARSLVLLDEVGRGTSTFDGLAIAWAVSEHLHEGPVRPLTVFATHYHELTELEAILPRVSNRHVEVREYGNEIVFLKRIAEGPSDRSYGIHVGRLAGLPERVVDRAREILANLEAGEWSADQIPTLASGVLAPEAAKGPPSQMNLFGPHHPLIDELLETDLDDLSPKEALEWLYKWRNQLT